MLKNRFAPLILMAAVTSLVAGCAPKADNSTAGAANTTVSPSPAAVRGEPISIYEPEGYRATLVLKAETTGGERPAAIPELTAEVARNGSERLVSLKMPGGEEVVYLNRVGLRYVILPGRKQYAELPSEVRGFDLPRLLMPGEIVDYLKKQPGFVRAGETEFNGRAAVRYVAKGTSGTNTQAGDVSAETQIYVDKETGLPLRAELLSQASGDAHGVRGVKVVAEMRDIRTDVAPLLIKVPEGYEKVSAEQVRKQVDAVMSATVAIAGAVLNQMSAQQGGG